MTNLTAHFFKSAKESYLIISTTCRPVGDKFPVASKKEARAMAKQLNAEPWNF